MFVKKKVRLILVIFMVILSLFGCMEANENLTPIEEDIFSEAIVDEADEVLGNLKIHFIDVGQGSSVFIVGADGKTMLYDAGGDDNGSGRIIVDYIQSIGYDHIDVAVFTHPHADHINGAPTIFEEIKIISVYYPKVTHTTKTFENFIEAVSRAGLKFKTAKAGVEIPFGETNAVIVAPISEQYENLNDYSATVKLTWKDTAVLLTGDVEKTSENEMINSTQDLDIDLLLVPHHGSNSSTTDEFLDKTSPDYAVISSGKDNSYGHPHREVIDRLAERNIKMYNTAESGNIVVISDGEKIEFISDNNQKVEQEKHIDSGDNTKNNLNEKLDIIASLSDSEPTQNSKLVLNTKVTSNGQPVEGANVNILVHFKSGTASYEGMTDKTGIVEIPYRIGRVSIGFEVKVDVVATKGNLESKTQLSFTPREN